MIRIKQLRVPISKDVDLFAALAKKLDIKKQEILEIKIHKQSLDARRKPNLFWVYEVDAIIKDEQKILYKYKDVIITPDERYKLTITGTQKMKCRPIIIGAGPAGLFAAYVLAESGYKPIVFERGEKIEDRIKTVEEFWETGNLNINSNVQFGEGGAGTFSDGKLNTLIKDERFIMRKVYETFVECGAPKEILYLNKPHIGTDILRNVVINMRNKIVSMGGEIKYNSYFNDFEINKNKLSKIRINNDWIDCETLILAIGHSARDTFEMLYNKKVNMQPKPFAVGLRIEHSQELINENQYGKNYPKSLPAAEYKLTYTTKAGRGVYTFCMCPGGYVVNASSEKNRLVVNGMSDHARNSENANSAVIVTITPDDFGTHPLGGIEFQRKIEEQAYQLGKGNIPVQLLGDYINNKETTELGNVKPILKGKCEFANLNNIFPKFINESLKEGVINFDKKIKGFANSDSLLLGVESRTSSPVRIIRDTNFISNIEGIYPCGEGAGYAGGITSSAIDGIKVVEKIVESYLP